MFETLQSSRLVFWGSGFGFNNVESSNRTERKTQRGKYMMVRSTDPRIGFFQVKKLSQMGLQSLIGHATKS